MGARAVFKIYSDDHDGAFWTGWGSPEFTMSGLAHWIEACRWRNQMPSAANYWEHTQISPENQFTESIVIDAPYPSDLNFRYELRATKALYGWGADLTVWSNLRPNGGLGNEYYLLNRLSVSNLLTGPIHALAAAGMRTLAKRASSRANPGGHLAEAVECWECQAAVHEAYAAIDETGTFVSELLTGLRAAK